jgi:hypothetical protein
VALNQQTAETIVTLVRPLHHRETTMQTNVNKRVLTFGDLIAATYRARKRGAAGFLRLAVNAHLIAFPGQQLFRIVKGQREGSRF